MFSQDISKKELYGVWLAEEVIINPDILPTDNPEKVDIVKKGFINSKYSFSKSGIFNMEMNKNAPEPFNDGMFNDSFYWNLNSNIIEIGTQKNGKSIINIGVSKKDNIYYFNLVGVVLKIKKIEESIKLKKPKKIKRKAYTPLPSKPIVNQDIKEDEIISFEEVDKSPTTMDCHLKHKDESLKKCVANSLNYHVARKFDLALGQELGLSGKIKIKNTFIINTEGNIVNIISDAKNQVLENEAKRVINLLPKMLPGKHNGNLINVRYEFPITINIQD